MNDQFYLDIHDSGVGSTIIFTHGWTDNRNAWDGVISNLDNEARCIAWSIRGHGNSFAPPPGQYTRNHTLSDLKKVVEKSEGNVILAGHSLGGYLSLAHCLLHPDDVAALILVGAGPGFRKQESIDQWNSSVIESAQKLDLPEGSEATALHTDAWVIDSLNQITVPTLVIVGEHDKRFRVSMSVFEKYLNVKSSIVIEDAGHSVHRKKPSEVADGIREFLGELSL
jgi:pimeloyl-ACP methyl ester carboxylesterase